MGHSVSLACVTIGIKTQFFFFEDFLKNLNITKIYSSYGNKAFRVSLVKWVELIRDGGYYTLFNR